MNDTLHPDDWRVIEPEFRARFAGRLSERMHAPRGQQPHDRVARVRVSAGDGDIVEVTTGMFLDHRLFGVVWPRIDGRIEPGTAASTRLTSSRRRSHDLGRRSDRHVQEGPCWDSHDGDHRQRRHHDRRATQRGDLSGRPGRGGPSESVEQARRFAEGALASATTLEENAAELREEAYRLEAEARRCRRRNTNSPGSGTVECRQLHRREDTHDMSNDNSEAFALVAFRCAGEDEDIWAVAEGDPYATLEAAIATSEITNYHPDEVVVISSATVAVDEVPQRADILVAYDGTKWTTQFHFDDGTERDRRGPRGGAGGSDGTAGEVMTWLALLLGVCFTLAAVVHAELTEEA